MAKAVIVVGGLIATALVLALGSWPTPVVAALTLVLGAAIRAALGILPSQRAILYAPTWRENMTAMVTFLDLERLAARLGPDHVILLRGHSRTVAFGASVSMAGVIDVTTYPEVTDLFLAAAERLGARIDHSVVVGDSLWDMLAARRCRALGVGLLSGGYGADELERGGAARVYEDPADMLVHLDEVGGRRVDLGERGVAVPRHADAVALVLEDVADQRPDVGLVVDHEDIGHHMLSLNFSVILVFSSSSQPRSGRTCGNTIRAQAPGAVPPANGGAGTSSSVPSCSSMIFLTIGSPRPVPLARWVT